MFWSPKNSLARWLKDAIEIAGVPWLSMESTARNAIENARFNLEALSVSSWEGVSSSNDIQGTGGRCHASEFQHNLTSWYRKILETSSSSLQTYSNIGLSNTWHWRSIPCDPPNKAPLVALGKLTYWSTTPQNHRLSQDARSALGSQVRLEERFHCVSK